MSNTTFFIVIPFDDDGTPALGHVSWHRARSDAEAEAAGDSELMERDGISVPSSVIVEVVSSAPQGA